jgi:hypothetical protein
VKHNDDYSSDEDDDLLPRLFRAMGPMPSLPVDMKQRWESAFSTELSLQIAARRRRRMRIMVSCAGTALLVVTAALFIHERPVTPPVAMDTVTQVTSVVGFADSFDGQIPRAINVGEELGPGQLRTGGQSSLALRYRDADVRLNSNTIAVLHPTRLQLLRGDIYVDAGVALRRGPAVVIETPFGTLTHVGTQFVVSVGDNEMRAAVREGAVALNAAGEHRTIDGADGPTQIVVSATGITTERISANSGIWTWTVDAAPGYIVDGRSANEFLVWATRQMGVELRYADDASRIHSETAIMHGNVGALSVARGLTVLGATTSLELDSSDPAILRVRLRSQDL